jgi:hypothetical protein
LVGFQFRFSPSLFSCEGMELVAVLMGGAVRASPTVLNM